jgi:adenylate cyclase 10
MEHCLGASELNKLIEAMLEYAYVCIVSRNIPLALRILSEALGQLRYKLKNKAELPWKASLTRGKIYTLQGFCRMEQGHFEDAMRSLHRSLREYGLTFPRGFPRRMKTCAFNFKQLFGLYVFPNTLMKHLNHWETVFANNLAECLSYLCTLYIVSEERGRETFASQLF